MSFSSEVKEELVKKTDSARHCQIAEFAAFMGMSGNVSEIIPINKVIRIIPKILMPITIVSAQKINLFFASSCLEGILDRKVSTSFL